MAGGRAGEGGGLGLADPADPDVASIETTALVRGGMPEAMARATVSQRLTLCGVLALPVPRIIRGEDER
jgi:hypothetical protein